MKGMRVIQFDGKEWQSFISAVRTIQLHTDLMVNLLHRLAKRPKQRKAVEIYKVLDAAERRGLSEIAKGKLATLDFDRSIPTLTKLRNLCRQLDKTGHQFRQVVKKQYEEYENARDDFYKWLDEIERGMLMHEITRKRQKRSV